MKLQTDPKAVAKLAAERAEENMRFRSFLKRSSLGTEELDAIVHRLYEEVAEQIDCQSESVSFMVKAVGEFPGGLPAYPEEVFSGFDMRPCWRSSPHRTGQTPVSC